MDDVVDLKYNFDILREHFTEDDWNGYGCNGVSIESINAAEKFLENSKHTDKLYKIIPDADGYLILSYKENKILVIIESEEQIHFAYKEDYAIVFTQDDICHINGLDEYLDKYLN